jgi:hypothetical protein
MIVLPPFPELQFKCFAWPLAGFFRLSIEHGIIANQNTH